MLPKGKLAVICNCECAGSTADDTNIGKYVLQIHILNCNKLKTKPK